MELVHDGQTDRQTSKTRNAANYEGRRTITLLSIRYIADEIFCAPIHLYKHLTRKTASLY